MALTDNVPCGILRRWVLEAGVRLVERGRLPRVDDAVYCTADELVAADFPAATTPSRRWHPCGATSRPGSVPTLALPLSAPRATCRTSGTSPSTAA